MKWVKRGLIFAPAGDLRWAVSHAALPFVEPVGDLCRVYYSARDERGRSRPGTFDVDLNEPHRILNVRRSPLLELGSLGAFDDNGVMASCLVPTGEKTHLYYVGWALGVTVPFYVNAGVAVRTYRDESFRRLSAAPMLDRSVVDPYLTGSVFVLLDEGRWRMWYTSATEWRIRGGAVQHRYHIKYAESGDGVSWNRGGVVCIDYRSDAEYAITRPCVIKDSDRYRMWYCYRGDVYRIGYAESDDGISWVRRDELAGIGLSDSGWDSEMAAYPFVFDHKGQRYMLYNGNGYGRTGIGLAVQDHAQV